MYYIKSSYHIYLPALKLGMALAENLGEPIFCVGVFKTYSEVKSTPENQCSIHKLYLGIYYVPHLIQLILFGFISLEFHRNNVLETREG